METSNYWPAFNTICFCPVMAPFGNRKHLIKSGDETDCPRPEKASCLQYLLQIIAVIMPWRKCLMKPVEGVPSNR